MDTSTVLIIVAIAAVFVLAVTMLLVTARRRANTGVLARETRQRDATTGARAPGTDVATTEARERTDEAKQGLSPTGTRTPAVYTPVDEEALGETRRQFLNRGVIAGMGLALGALGAAVLGFLWPPNTGASGFGGIVDVGSLNEIDDTIDNKKLPFYNASAKTYIVKYPKNALGKAKGLAAYDSVFPSMQEGYVALYQRCVHLGCRVPFCSTSQWFECPCHGSKYNRVGEIQGGPAPRGLDRFVPTISGGRLSVDTSSTSIVFGPPIGTNTTGQSPEGAPCV